MQELAKGQAQLPSRLINEVGFDRILAHPLNGPFSCTCCFIKDCGHFLAHLFDPLLQAHILRRAQA